MKAFVLFCTLIIEISEVIMKKKIAILIAAMLTAGCLSACGTAAAGDDTDRINIVTTIFPEYDWVMNILGSNPADAEVTMLLDNGVDLHSYQPTADDIMKASTCDLFIYVGGESDEWVEDVLRGSTNKDMVVINLLDVLGDQAKEEELVEGMQEEDDHESHEEEHSEEGPEYDEHVWLSLRNAAVLTKSISEALQKIDGNNAKVYQDNADAYIAKLNELDKKYEDAVSSAAVKTLLFGDRFPFRYLTDDYGLSYYAAFVGCSAETEASFETITFLAGKADELSLHSVMTIEGNDHKIAETIIQNTAAKDQQILTMDSLQSTTAKDAENGTTYLGVMESNLAVLEDALK